MFVQQPCLDKEDKVYRGNNQVINLTTSYVWSGCKKKDLDNESYLECTGKNNTVKAMISL